MNLVPLAFTLSFLMASGCLQPPEQPLPVGGFEAEANYRVQEPGGNGTLRMVLNARSIRMADDSFSLAHLLIVDLAGPTQLRATFAMTSLQQVVRTTVCMSQGMQGDCPEVSVRWHLDGGTPEGFGMLRDIQEDGEFEPWVSKPEMPFAGVRAPVPVFVRTLKDVVEVEIPKSEAFPSSEFIHGVYEYKTSSDFPSRAMVAAASPYESVSDLQDLVVGEPLPTLDSLRSPRVQSRRAGIEMFSGEEADSFGAGYTPRAALAHLRNASLEARNALEAGGCPVVFRAHAPVAQPVGPSAALVELGILPATGGVPDMYRFTAFQGPIGVTPIFGDVTPTGPDDSLPLTGTCDAVRKSPAAVSSEEFLRRARALAVQHGGEEAFVWFAADQIGFKPLVDGTAHFALWLYPQGFDAGQSGTYFPYRLKMDADTGWWEGFDIGADDWERIDTSN